MTDNLLPPSLEELEKKLLLAKKKVAESDKEKEIGSPSVLRIGGDLVAGVIVGSVAGYFLDKFFNTWPIFFVVCFFLGAIAGGLNIYRAISSTSDNK